MRLMGFGRVGSEIRLGGRGFVVCALDFGPGSVDGWLARHVMVESGADRPPTRPARRRTVGAHSRRVRSPARRAAERPGA